MAKSSVFGHWFAGPFMRAMQHIPVDRRAGAAAFEAAVRALKDGEVVGVFPEATISSSFTVKDLKAGAARMAVDAGVPIVPAAVWGGHRIATKDRKVQLRRNVPVTVLLGEPIVPSRGSGRSRCCAAPGRRWRRSSTRRSAAIRDQPSGPDDRWWLPAHLGGTAPTPEDAAAHDDEHASGRAGSAVTSAPAKAGPLARARALVPRRR